MSSETCNSRTSRAILSAVAALNVGFGLVIGLCLLPWPNFLVQILFVGADVVLTVLLIAGVFEKKRRYLTVFLIFSTIMLLLETASFAALKASQMRKDDLDFGIGVFVVRWSLQMAAVWAYYHLDNGGLPTLEETALKA